MAAAAESIYVDCARVITLILKGGHKYDVKPGTFRVCHGIQFGYINPEDDHGDHVNYMFADPLFQRVEQEVPDSEWHTYSHEYTHQLPMGFTCLAEDVEHWDERDNDPPTFRVTGLLSSIVAVETGS